MTLETAAMNQRTHSDSEHTTGRASVDQSGEVTIMPRGEYIRTKIVDQNAAKQVIAKHIAEKYVTDFDAVLLDAGSTAELIAVEMFELRRFLSVLTNNMGAYASYTRARALSGTNPIESSQPTLGTGGALNGNELLITGGRYVDTYEALFGERTIASIKPFTPRITIIGISGLRTDEGVFCHGEEESAVKNLLWTKPTDVRVIAADWTKIGKRDAHAFGQVKQLLVQAKEAVVVTSKPPQDAPSKELEEFEEQIQQMRDWEIVVDQLDVPQGNGTST